MTQVIHYQCEKCGTLYDTQKECEDCEAFHIGIIGPVKYLYYSRGMGTEAKYPYGVMVKMEDGKEFYFKR